MLHGISHGGVVNRHPRDAIDSLSMTAPHGHRQRRQGPVCGLAQNGLSLSGRITPAGIDNAGLDAVYALAIHPAVFLAPQGIGRPELALGGRPGGVAASVAGPVL